MASLDTLKPRWQILRPQDGLRFVEKCIRNNIYKNINEFDRITNLNNNSKDDIRRYFIIYSKRSVLNLSYRLLLFCRFIIGSYFSMIVFNFQFNILELIICEIIACLTKYISVTQTIYIETFIYLSQCFQSLVKLNYNFMLGLMVKKLYLKFIQIIKNFIIQISPIQYQQNHFTRYYYPLDFLQSGIKLNLENLYFCRKIIFLVLQLVIYQLQKYQKMKNHKLKLFIQGMSMIQKQKQKQSTQIQLNTIKVNYQNQQSSITVIAPQIYRLQKLYKANLIIQLRDIIDDFTEYTTLPSQILGKRSSKIIISKSSKYCLKIIQQQDISKISEIILNLITMFQDYENNFLINILYIFIIQHTVLGGLKLTDRYIIMPNIRSNFDNCIKTFDIKGHLQSRAINQQDFQDFKFGKDENFVKCQQLKFIKQHVPQQKLVQILFKLQQNLKFLTKHCIIDYSVLISLQKEQQNIKQTKYICQSYRIGDGIVLKCAIIDYFQIYNQKKKIQNKFKSIFKKSVSSVEPEVYSKRLIKFLEENLLLN